jgi:hypothetical protein
MSHRRRLKFCMEIINTIINYVNYIFCVLIRNMTSMCDFEVISNKFNVMLICIKFTIQIQMN